MFKSRSESKANSAAPSIDDLRRQARHRLIGVAVLVLVAVVGFPMVFDTTPRPIAADVPIVIPSQPVLAPLTPVAPLTAAAPMEPIAEKAPPEPVPESPTPLSVVPNVAANTAAAPAEAASATGERYVVQVGAYAEQARAREVRLKIERAGLKTYTQVAKTAQGNRIRVRLGPFDTRAEADQVAQKIKSMGLTPGVLTL